MKSKISVSIFIFISAFFTYSCSSEKNFTIEGTVKDGDGKMLYLEHVGVNRLTIVDSVKVDKKQHFSFKGQNKTGAPDFYRIRLKNQFINIAVDSTETVAIQADTLNFARNYTVEGSSGNEAIKELTLLQVQTNAGYNKIRKQYEDKEISTDETVILTNELMSAYKDKAKDYIFSNLASASAYFALFQQVNNMLIFNPYDKDDSRIFGAVANTWNVTYPDAPRTKHLVDVFKNTLSELRRSNVELDAREVSSVNALDFTLLSVNDTEYTLSEVSKNKVLLLDFTSYEMQNSPAHVQLLSDLYGKYSRRGFEILQVSLDTDLHFWKNAAINLPWICVNDPQSAYSPLLVKFNIQSLPAGFLFDKEGEIVARIEDYSVLEKELQALLK